MPLDGDCLFTLKKIGGIAQERFKIHNMAYTQLYIDYMFQKDPYKIKFFDEMLKILYIYGHWTNLAKRHGRVLQCNWLPKCLNCQALYVYWS